MSEQKQYFPQPYHTNQYMHWWDFLKNYRYSLIRIQGAVGRSIEILSQYDNRELQEAQNLGQTSEHLNKLFKRHAGHVLYFNNQAGVYNNNLYNTLVVDDLQKACLWPDKFNKDLLFILNESDIFFPFPNDFELVATAVITVPASSYPGRAVWRPTDKIQYKKDGEYGVGNMVVRNKSSNKLELWNPYAWMGVGHKSNVQRYIYAASVATAPITKDKLDLFYADTLAMDNLIRNAALDKKFMTALLSPRINPNNYKVSKRALRKNDKSEIDNIQTYYQWKTFSRDR